MAKYKDTNIDIDSLEAQFGLDDNINIMVTSPMKQAIRMIARMSHMSMSDVVRQTLVKHLPQKYPKYPSIYQDMMEEQLAFEDATDRFGVD